MRLVHWAFISATTNYRFRAKPSHNSLSARLHDAFSHIERTYRLLLLGRGTGSAALSITESLLRLRETVSIIILHVSPKQRNHLMSGTDKLDVGTGGSIEVLENQILQSGYGPGPDGFRILVEQSHMPTKVLRMVLEVSGSLAQASASTYADIALDITTPGGVLNSSKMSTEKGTHDGTQYVVYLFKFGTAFLPSLISNYNLLNARTPFGITPQLIKTSAQFIAPEVYSASASLRGPFGMTSTTSQFGMFDITCNNSAMSSIANSQIGVLAWSNGYDLRLDATRNIQLYDSTTDSVLHTFAAKLELGVPSRIAYSNSTVPMVSPPWIPYGSTGFESTLGSVEGGHHWLIKRTPHQGTHAMYTNGVIETFPGSQFTPVLTEDQRQHLGDQTYNVILLKYNHIASAGSLLYYHEKEGESGPGSKSPYVMSGSGGVWMNFGHWGTNISLAVTSDGPVTLLIYNDATTIHAMLTADDGATWQVGDQTMNASIFIAGGHHIYRDTSKAVQSVWYGSSDSSLLLPEDDLKAYAMRGTTQEPGGYSLDIYQDLTHIETVTGHELGVVAAIGRTYANYNANTHATHMQGTIRNTYFYDTAKGASHVVGYANPTPGVDGVVYAWTVKP